MKKLLPFIFTILTLAYVSSANAENNWYLGALYNTQDISINGRDFKTAGIISGYQFIEYFALEARFAKGTSGYSSFYGTAEEPTGDYSEDINIQASLLIKASYPLFDSFKLYGLAGYSTTKLKAKGLGSTNDSEGNINGDYPFKITSHENGFTYGLGLDYQINEQFNVFIDYQILPNFEPNSSVSESWKSMTFGVNYSF